MTDERTVSKISILEPVLLFSIRLRLHKRSETSVRPEGSHNAPVSTLTHCLLKL